MRIGSSLVLLSRAGSPAHPLGNLPWLSLLLNQSLHLVQFIIVYDESVFHLLHIYSAAFGGLGRLTATAGQDITLAFLLLPQWIWSFDHITRLLLNSIIMLPSRILPHQTSCETWIANHIIDIAILHRRQTRAGPLLSHSQLRLGILIVICSICFNHTCLNLLIINKLMRISKSV